MNKQTKAALRESIAHWERMRKNWKDGEDVPSVKHCHLCGLFRNREPTCSGCPVKRKTGKTGCADTPYFDAADAWYYGEKARFKHHAQAMIDFLKSLEDAP